MGTTRLCQACKWEAQAAILARRPDLRAPTGIGFVAGGPSVPGGLPLLRCDLCPASWTGTPFMDCPWCLDREHYQTQEQTRMDRARYVELVNRIREGDVDAITQASDLLDISTGGGRMDVRWAAHLLASAIETAA